MTTAAQAPAASGPITLEDVRSALGDTDPKSTNAGKLRKILGRGSFETIQKHLELIRKERAPVLPGTQAPPPPPPKEAVEAVWLAAWSACQAAAYGRTERLSAERDAALERSAIRALDIEGLTADLDGLLEKVAIAESHANALATKAEADLATAARAAVEAAKELEKMTAAKEKAEVDAEHAAALAIRDAQIANNVMQGTINKLNDQIVELKGLLRTTMTPAPTTKAA